MKRKHSSAILLILILQCLLRNAESRNFKIGLMIPTDCCFESLAYETTASAISLALEKAMEDGFLQNHTWSVEKVFSPDPGSQARHAVELITVKDVDVILGHPFSNRNIPVAYVTSSYNFPHVSWASTSTELSNKNIFRTLIRTAAPFTTTSLAVVEILRFFHWSVVSMLMQNDGTLCTYAAEGLTEAFASTNISLKVNALYKDTTSTQVLIQHLTDVKLVSRIVIICGWNSNIRTIMLEACKLKMCHGDFVFIDPKFSLTGAVYNPWFSGDKDDDAAREAFNHVLHLNFAYWYNEESRVRSMRLREEIPYLMTLPPWNNTYAVDNGLNATYFSIFLYDSAYLIAMWWDHALKNKIDHKNGTAMFHWTRNIKFEGGSGKVQFTENADPIPTFWIEDLKVPGNEQRVVGVVETNAKNQSVTLWTDPRWMTKDGKAPPSVPVCGFDGKKCLYTDDSDNVAFLIGLSCGFIVIITMTLMILYFVRKRKIQEDIMKMIWKLNRNDISFTKAVKTFSRSMTSRPSVHSEKSPIDHTSGKGQVGRYLGQFVFVKNSLQGTIKLTQNDLVSLKNMREIIHNNVNVFIGACVDGPVNFTVFAYGQKGSLQEILENTDIKLEWMFKLALIKDLASGMQFLHGSVVKSHGRLKSSNCVVDSKWSLKITDYGISAFQIPINTNALVYPEQFHALLWTAPEILRTGVIDPKGTRKGDVYSFGIVLHEICYRSGVFPYPLLNPEEIIQRVKTDTITPCRPSLIEDVVVPNPLYELMKHSWSEDPQKRPEFSDILSIFGSKFPETNKSIMDTMLTMLEKYANNLEDIVKERTRELDEETEKTERLLYKMIPREIADRLKRGESSVSETFDSVTIFFSDIVGFTRMSADMTATEVVDFLNDLYTMFDDIIAKYDAYKVETIGDAYLVASGLPVQNGNRHADEIAQMAVCIVRETRGFRIRGMPHQAVTVRVGIHTGPVCAGVIGLSMPRYCVFGDTVNTASRMESNGLPQRIHVTRETKEALANIGKYEFTSRGEIEIKGKGKMETFFLVESSRKSTGIDS